MILQLFAVWLRVHPSRCVLVPPHSGDPPVWHFPPAESEPEAHSYPPSARVHHRQFLPPAERGTGCSGVQLKQHKMAAKVARMKAQLSTATSAGNLEDRPGSCKDLSEFGSTSCWSTGMLGDFRWFWCKQEVTTKWLWEGQERHSFSPDPKHVRQDGWQGRHACTVECSTQLSNDKLSTCSPELKPGGQDFTQPCKKSEKPVLHSGKQRLEKRVIADVTNL